MRFLMTVKMNTAKFNAAVRDGSAEGKMKKILGEIKPEAAYFIAEEGKRTGYLIVNMTDVSQIPALAEPWFLHFEAELEMKPVMTAEDLGKAGLEGLGKKWG